MFVKWCGEEHFLIGVGELGLGGVGLMYFWKEQLTLFVMGFLWRGAVDVSIAVCPKSRANIP